MILLLLLMAYSLSAMEMEENKLLSPIILGDWYNDSEKYLFFDIGEDGYKQGKQDTPLAIIPPGIRKFLHIPVRYKTQKNCKKHIAIYIPGQSYVLNISKDIEANSQVEISSMELIGQEIYSGYKKGIFNKKLKIYLHGQMGENSFLKCTPVAPLKCLAMDVIIKNKIEIPGNFAQELKDEIVHYKKALGTEK